MNCIDVTNQITRSLTKLKHIACLCEGTPRCGEAMQKLVILVGIKSPIEAATG